MLLQILINDAALPQLASWKCMISTPPGLAQALCKPASGDSVYAFHWPASTRPLVAQMPGLSIIVTTMPTAPIGNPESTDDEQVVPADGLAS